MLKALCPASKSCTVLDKVMAGRDASGNDLVFAGVEERSAAKRQARASEEGESDASGGDEPCLPAPYGLLHVKSGRVLSVEPIVTLRAGDCSYGARDGGETISFDGKAATYRIEGGSNWGWSDTTTWETTPRLRPIHKKSLGWWRVSSNYWLRKADLRRGRTTVTWFVPDCDKEGNPPDSAAEGQVDYEYIEIPRLRPGGAVDWKSASFPTEGLTVTSQKHDGFITFGKPGTARDARFRVIAPSARELLIEVADPEVSGHAKRWVNDDHLEIWAGPQLVDYQTHCVLRSPAGKDLSFTKHVGVAQQWGVRTTDGAVFRGMGKPQRDPAVERVELDSTDWGRVYRFRVGFAKELGSVTVAYSDSDHGKRQLRLIATSRIQLRDSLSLGALAPVGDNDE